MKFLRNPLMFAALTIALGVSAAGFAMAQGTVENQPGNGIQAGVSYQNDTSLPLYYLPAREGDTDEDSEKGREDREAAANPRVPGHHVDMPDTVVQRTFGPSFNMPAPISSFDGLINTCGCAPPDTNGEVGETQYVQMVNESYQVFNKVTGATVAGPSSISSLWAGFGGLCETGGAGDPIVMYDQLAKRWIITQFAGGSVITDECIAVSTSSDAAGSYNRYGFHLGSNFFDYPHLGVWPDGYYMSMNVFNTAATTYLGPQPFVFDRSAMIAGTPATFLTATNLGSTHAPLLPADLDGMTPPSLGAPEPFVEFPDSGSYNVYRFHADFVTPVNSTFTLAASPSAAAFTAACTGSRACVPTPATATDYLDGIGDRLMYRLAYRNFGGHEALVGNYTVSSASVTAPRWFEMRSVTSGTPSIFQEGTYQPDTTWRWMGSAAMDTNGNLAIGFSASSATTNPQLRYAGRLAGDPLNTLPQGETTLFSGAGHQVGGGNRWGDYSDLTVDPVDDCTFWYTNEYHAANGSAWRTRIGSFKFPSCSLTPGFSLAATPTNTSVCVGTPANYAISVGSTSGFNGAVTLAAVGNPASSTVSLTPNPVPTLPGSSAMQIMTTGVAAGSYPITINGTASGASNQSTSVNLAVFAAIPGAPSLTAPANAAASQPVRPTFTWSGSNSESYKIDIATDSAFGSIVLTQTVTGATFTPSVDLSSNTTYYWRVTPTNACGDGAVSSTFSFTTQPLPGDCSAGATATPVYSYGFESGLSGWTLGAGSVGNAWADNTTSFHTGAHSWKATDPATVSDQRFVSPGIVLPSGQLPLTLQFWNKRDIEAQPSGTACYDGAILEVSTNAGTTWTQIGSAALLTDPYTGLVSSSFSNPLANLQAWCGVKGWTNSIVDIGTYAGQTVQFRYRAGSDNSASHDGWYIDDVKVQSCVAGATYTVGGNVGGLTGSGLVLSLNSGAQTLAVPTSGPFTFPTGLANGAPYAVTVGTQPTGQTCSVASGSGTIAGANVTNVAVTCVAAPTFTVGGTVSGLAGSGLVMSLNSGAQTAAVPVNGTFTFPTGLANAASYVVTVGTQPTLPSQTCTVTNGSGVINSANVTNVAVSCTTNTYTVGGTVSGLAGTGFTLALGAQTLPLSVNGTFTFPTALASGASYAVTVGTQPSSPTQTCTVTNGSGTIGSANVTNVAVSCTTNTYTVGGTVSGLAGAGLSLSLGAQTLPLSTNGTFTFPTALASGASYAVTVGAQPSSPTQTCAVTNGSGTIGAANVTNVTVSCTTNSYTVGGTVSGLVGSGLVVTLNGTTNLPVAANGSFTFAGPLLSGATYAVTVTTQPTGPIEVCTVTNGSGTVGGANVTNVAVTCSDVIFKDGFDG